MTEKHTPGPWEFEPDGEAPPTLGFACVFHAGTRQHVASRVRPEDAALVAAAPDLLAASDGLLAFLRTTNMDPLHPAFAALQQAVAKARGG